jgi:GTP-binding protein HflX
MHSTKDEGREKVLLVILDFKKIHSDWSLKDIEEEMKELVVACDGEVIDTIVIKIVTPTAGYLINEGRVQGIADLVAMKQANTVIFSYDLKGSQQRNLEEIIKVKIIDRTQLILDIFARRAQSNEGKMQVELAQLEYLMPRLVGKGIELSRQGGGIGTLGPGETKLEVDRRRIAQRIDKLRQGLKEITANRVVKRKKRQEKSVPAISLVGYTNAGKSTLLNTLTGAGQITRDGLFTTLDSLSRQTALPNNQKVIISDTVGFMHDLPHHLIESFKATLEEVKESDLLIHVLDVSNPQFRNLHQAVLTVLKALEAIDKPTITVLNKIDRLDSRMGIKDLVDSFSPAVAISAQSGENIEQLNQLMITMLEGMFNEIDVYIPIKRMDLVNLIHTQGQVFAIKYYESTINIRASVPAKLAGLIRQHAVNNPSV